MGEKLATKQHMFQYYFRKLRQEEDRDPEWSAAKTLGCGRSDLVAVTETWDQISADAMRFAFGQQIQQAKIEPSSLYGLVPADPPMWRSVDFGNGAVRVPLNVTATFPAGRVSKAKLVVRAHDLHNQTIVTVWSAPDDDERAHEYLEDLKAAVIGPSCPYRNRILEATWVQGLTLQVVTDLADSREQLVFAEEIWDAVDRNVTRMVERMDRLTKSGLGGNRGLMLAGPPGTGKTALCRSIAADYVGTCTVFLASAKTGAFALNQLYRLAGDLSPALVLLEDLDLLVGDREGQGQQAALVDFLTVLDGLMTGHSGVITVATTNDVASIDAAAQRAARFDQIVDIDLPGPAQRVEILRRYLEGVPNDIDPSRFAEATTAMSGADIRELVRSAVLDAETEQIGDCDLDDAVALWRRFRDEQEQRVGLGGYA